MSRVLLIKNANLYDPDPKGIRDILIVDEKYFLWQNTSIHRNFLLRWKLFLQMENGNSWLCGPACSCDWRGRRKASGYTAFFPA